MSSNYIKDIEALPVYKSFPSGKEGLFVWIPKTGGTSIHRKFEMPRAGLARPRFKKHYSIHELGELVSPQIFARSFKYAIVRNPWDRLVSFYFYRRRVYLKKDPDKTPIKDKLYSSFETWMETEYERGELGHRKLRPQSLWIFNTENNLLIDYLGRFEELEESFRIICAALQVPTEPLGHYNESKKRPVDYRSLYTSRLNQLVEEKYARDIELLGYRF